MMHIQKNIPNTNAFRRYSIFRILGNETPPRDEPDARLKTLNFILDNEPCFPNAIKCWVLNCIHDRERRDYLAKLLSDREQYVIVIPIWREKYKNAKNLEEKITHLIGINRARNIAIKHGRIFSDFTFVLDGDCFFSQELWNKTCFEIESDQKKFTRKMYSVPTSRATFDHTTKSNDPMLLAEPMTIHRYDSHFFYDESIPFGNGDKLKFLYKLGHSTESGQHHKLLKEDLCKSVGLVHHVTASDYKIELNQKLRIELRNQSISRLMHQVDNPLDVFPQYHARSHGKVNNYWSKIQSFFNFRGLYSHWGWQLPSGSKFVEVGSWLGASIVFLATEFKIRNKEVEIFSVDIWKESNELKHLVQKMGGPDKLYNSFLNNIKNAGVDDIVKPIKLNSESASRLFDNNSLDAVFIDASHDYESVINYIKHWYPKVKIGGIIGGHDYVAGNAVSEAGIIPAVNSFFIGKNLEIGHANRSWHHVKR